MVAAILRSPIVFVLAWLTLAGGCGRLPDTGKTSIKAKTLSELQGYLHNHKANLDRFRLRGPFAVARRDDHEIRLSADESLEADLFLSAHKEKAPLVVILHGHDNAKEDHTFQAMHLASWGMHSLAVQLPNSGPWVRNGKALARLVHLIYRAPEIIDSRIDVNKIILVGHSFGGFAVAVALAEGAPATGGILLDPAAVGRDFRIFLRQINAPVMLLGADQRVFWARNRESFYRYIRGGVAEVSIKDATHEDAQFPAGFGSAAEELQLTFVSALTSAALSLSATGNYDYAWASFGDEIANGTFFDAKRK